MKIQFATKVPVLLLFFIMIISCSKEETQIQEEKIGKLDCVDFFIEASKSELQINSQKQSLLVTTKISWWSFGEISFNNSKVDLEGLDLDSQNLVIEKSDFRIERKNGSEIHIALNENTTGKERVLSISLSGGGCGGFVRLNQAKN